MLFVVAFHIEICQTMFSFLLSLILLQQSYCEETTTFNGHSGSDPTYLKSTGFPTYSLVDGSAYNYSFENKDHFGYVRATFTDFKIHPNCVLKIYDGGKEGVISLWTSGMRTPVFQSNRNHLSIVFKCTATSVTHQYDYPGWRALVSYVKSHRDAWTNPPATGLCPDIQDSTLWLRWNENQFTVNTLPNISCTWTIETTFQTVLAVLMPDQASELSLKVHQGKTSFGEEIAATVQTVQDTIYHIYTGTDLYLHLQGYISPGQSFRFAYNVLEASAKASASSVGQGTFPYTCPEKDCAREYGSNSGCVRYWDSCGEQDPICDASVYTSPCGTSSQCFGDPVDKCDGFSDCSLGEDETACPGDIQTFTTIGYAFAGLTGVFIVVAFICVCVKMFCKMLKQCCECLCENFCGCMGRFCECLGECCGLLGRGLASCCRSCGRKSRQRLNRGYSYVRHTLHGCAGNRSSDAVNTDANAPTTNAAPVAEPEQLELSVDVPEINVTPPRAATAPPGTPPTPGAPPSYNSLASPGATVPSSPSPSDDVPPPSYDQAVDRIRRSTDAPFTPPPTYHEVVNESSI